MLLFIIVLFVHMQCCLHVQLTTHSARMEGHALVWVQVTPSVFVLLHILGCTACEEGGSTDTGTDQQGEHWTYVMCNAIYICEHMGRYALWCYCVIALCDYEYNSAGLCCILLQWCEWISLMTLPEGACPTKSGPRGANIVGEEHLWIWHALTVGERIQSFKVPQLW